MEPVTLTVRNMNSATAATALVAAVQHIAESLERIAATLPADRKDTIEKHSLELRRIKAGLIAELA